MLAGALSKPLRLNEGGNMNWQSEPLTCGPAARPKHTQEWQRAFVAEWQRLAEGCADLEQTADLALELYATRGTRNPVDIAREAWGAPVGG